MTENGTVSWRELLAEATAALGEPNEARWLCEEVSGWRGASFTANLSEPATHRQVVKFDALVERRRTGEPLQYVLGSWPFRTIELMVDRRVLIPRPETEVVAGIALDLLGAMPSPVRAVDLGTGSGAIALALVAERPLASIEIWACDSSLDALDVARANLAGLGRRGVSVRLGHGDWFDALPADLLGTIDLVVANPPYIAADDPEVDASVRDWEPGVALFAEHDGLAAYEVIVAQAPCWLADGGWLVLEIGFRQGPAVTALCTAAGLVDIAVKSDLAAHDRVVIARRANR
jgi:release factor glutamine methyltransferase